MVKSFLITETVLYVMKKYKRLFFVILALMISLISIDAFRKAFVFDTRVAYAANEPTYGWIMIDDVEVQIQFETTLASNTLSIKDFNEIYGYNLDSGSYVVEQWCKQHDNSLCQLRFVGIFLVENGSRTLLPVMPVSMYY